MSKYDITHTCGHTATHQIAGTNTQGQRERRAEWLATTPCYECAKAARIAAEKTAAAEASAKLAAEGVALPKLIGTPKQIEWAQTIRAKALQSVADLQVEASQKYGEDHADHAKIQVAFAQRKAWLASQVSATFWIDNRGNNGRDWFNAAATGAESKA